VTQEEKPGQLSQRELVTASFVGEGPVVATGDSEGAIFSYLS
jgi:hypothetical protein